MATVHQTMLTPSLGGDVNADDVSLAGCDDCVERPMPAITDARPGEDTRNMIGSWVTGNDLELVDSEVDPVAALPISLLEIRNLCM